MEWEAAGASHVVVAGEVLPARGQAVLPVADGGWISLTAAGDPGDSPGETRQVYLAARCPQAWPPAAADQAMPPARRVPRLWPAVTQDAGHIASGVRSPRQARMVSLPGPRLPARIRISQLAGRPARLLIDFLPLRQGLLARRARLNAPAGPAGNPRPHHDNESGNAPPSGQEETSWDGC